MRAKKSVMSISSMKIATLNSKVHIENILDSANQIKTDSDKIKRQRKQLCKCCYYSSSVGGSCMTHRECMSCGSDELYSSTYTDILCHACAVKHELCKHCGGDIDLRVRRKDYPIGEDRESK